MGRVAAGFFLGPWALNCSPLLARFFCGGGGAAVTSSSCVACFRLGAVALSGAVEAARSLARFFCSGGGGGAVGSC